jgi:hypothetical protein
MLQRSNEARKAMPERHFFKLANAGKQGETP